MSPSVVPSAGGGPVNGSADADADAAAANGSTKPVPKFPTKTDKPRPHVCGTCQRSFARLEHLKRHERSHTKEKPFECPECTRCFARRDLLLRHQQKLHMTTTPSSRPRNRRESTSSAVAGPGRVRKNSIATATAAAATMRPRANTISHIDGAQFHMIAAASVAAARNIKDAGGHSHHASLNAMNTPFQYGGMASVMGQRVTNHGLPKLDTNGFITANFGGGLRTAPPMGGHGRGFDFEGLLFGNTINPNALHCNDSPQSMALDPTSPYPPGFPVDENFECLNTFDHHVSFEGNTDNAVDGSSPSAISTASQSGISEVMLDGSNNPATTAGALWQQAMMAPPLMNPNPFSLDMSPFPDFQNGNQSSPSNPPKSLVDQYFSTSPPSMSSLSPPAAALNVSGMEQNMNCKQEASDSMTNGSQYKYPAVSTITDLTRRSLYVTLSQPATFGSAREYSFSAANGSPSSPNSAARSNGNSEHVGFLLSTAELQRYVGAYIHYFQPHLPFLNQSSLTFDIPIFANKIGGQNSPGVIGPRGCLLLSMAAIGSLYEGELATSKEIFDMAKKMIQISLEERRKLDIRKGQEGSGHYTGSRPELRLVQAMLLNVVYGFNCGDKTAGDIASTHCAALVALARAAGLLSPQPRDTAEGHSDVQMADDEMTREWLNGIPEEDLPEDEVRWQKWKFAEERKRTLYSIFILSSLLVSAYNHSPALTNSETRQLDLPCDEAFWCAEDAADFQAMGGVQMANHNRITFHDALGELLSAHEKQHQQNLTNWQEFGPGSNIISPPPTCDLQPSTFGCLVLINALHNYIWETRSRHHNKIWTNEETEKMHNHVKPALQAWEAAWKNSSIHDWKRPNPNGAGPLSADCIPLLDLAYVRLFVNLSRSKEKFWNRDYDGMAEELARSSEITQHATGSDSSSDLSTTSDAYDDSLDSPPTVGSEYDESFKSESMQFQTKKYQPFNVTSKRERNLRNAAVCATESLTNSDKLGVTFAGFTFRELPLQSALRTFDCASVLAEWVATVQERVGKYVGILGKDDIDWGQVPSILLLEEEDVDLFDKIDELLQSAEKKLVEEGDAMEWENKGQKMQGGWENRLSSAHEGGYGSKILNLTAYTFERLAVWPVTRLMAQSLQVQANHMQIRAEKSITQRG